MSMYVEHQVLDMILYKQYITIQKTKSITLLNGKSLHSLAYTQPGVSFMYSIRHV